jgi:DinB family protein
MVVSSEADMAQTPGALDPLVEYELSWLGNDDPAEVLAATPANLRKLVAGVDDDVLRRRPSAQSWSAMELLGHLADIELIHAERFRRILCEDRPTLVPFDPEAWTATLDHNNGTPSEYLNLFEAIRDANLTTWRRSSAQQRVREYIHGQRGAESYELLFKMCAGHDRLHSAQLQEALRSARKPG